MTPAEHLADVLDHVGGFVYGANMRAIVTLEGMSDRLIGPPAPSTKPTAAPMSMAEHLAAVAADLAFAVDQANGYLATTVSGFTRTMDALAGNATRTLDGLAFRLNPEVLQEPWEADLERGLSELGPVPEGVA